MPLDNLDLMLIETLEDDARQSVRTLAKKLGVNRTTARYRLNRLMDKGILTVSCQGNPEFLGYYFMFLLGINVSPGKAKSVSDQLVPLPSIEVVSLTVGRYNILVWVALRDRSDLIHFLSENLADISDITSMEMMFYYHALTFFESQTYPSCRYPQYDPCDLDLSIINAMQLNPRQSIVELARTVGCNRATAKTHLEKLVNDGVIRFVSVIDRKALGYDVNVAILIKAKPDKIFAVAQELSAKYRAGYVVLVAGQWQIFYIAWFQNNKQLHDFLTETIPLIPGITEFESVHLVEIPKLSANRIG